MSHSHDSRFAGCSGKPSGKIRRSRSRLAGEPPDVLITPQVGHISLLEFDKAGELIDLGRKAIDDNRAQIESALEYLG